MDKRKPTLWERILLTLLEPDYEWNEDDWEVLP